MPENETEQVVAIESQEVGTEVSDLHSDAKPTFGSVDIKAKETQEDQPETTGDIQETKEESGGSFISRVKAAAKAKLGLTATEEETGDDIPDEFTKAARKMNWSDEDTADFAAQGNEGGPFTNEQLKEMIPDLLGEDTAKADETSDTTEVESETTETKGEDSQEGDELKQLREDVAALKEELGVRQEKSKEKEVASFVTKASELFDKASEEFEVFGKTADLPTFPDGRVIPTSPQMKARNEVFGMAQQLKEAGIPGDKALEFSYNAYKGANLAVETQRNVIKGLKKREQTLGGKRVSHKATEAANLTGPETIAAVKRRHGK